MKKIFYLLFFTLILTYSFSQSKEEVSTKLDSILSIKNDTQKISLLIAFYEKYGIDTISKGENLFEYLKNLSKQNNHYNLCHIYLYWGNDFRNKKDIQKAKSKFLQAALCAKKTNELSVLASAMSNIGIIQYFYADYTGSIRYFKKTLKTWIKLADTNKIASSYNSIAIVNFELGQYDSSVTYYKKALNLAKIINDKDLIAKIYNNIALVYKAKGEYNKALEYNLKSLKIKKALKDTSQIANTYNNIGVVYKKIGKYDKALTYYKKALTLYKLLKDSLSIADQYNNIGLLYLDKGKYVTVTEYLFKAINIYQKIGRIKSLMRGYNSLAEVYIKEKEYDKAIHSINQAIKIGLSTGLKKELSRAYNNLGETYLDKGDIDKAYDYFIKSLVLKQQLGNKEGVGTTLISLGELFYKKGHLLKSLSYLRKSAKILKQINNENGYANTLGEMSKVLLATYKKNSDKKYLDDALKKGLEAYQIAKKEELWALMLTASNVLKEAYTYKGNPDKALEFANIYIMARDTMFAQEKMKAILETQAKYDFKQKEQQIKIQKEQLARMRAENERKQVIIRQERLIRMGMITFSVGLLFFLGWTYKNYKDKSKMNILLEKQQEDLETMNIELSELVEETKLQRDKIENQKKTLEQLYGELKQSISYAKNLQISVLPQISSLNKYVKDSFVLFYPKDVVSGDFYWWSEVEGKIIMTVADCTGHGVPGAFMTMLGISLLREIVEQENITYPAAILNRLRREIIRTLKQKGEFGEHKDGMDMAVFMYDTKDRTISFSGANNSGYIVCNKDITLVKGDSKKVKTIHTDDSRKMIEIKPDKMPVGYYPVMTTFNEQVFKIDGDIKLYMFSDGFPDQFGGPKNKKYKSINLKSFLFSISHLSMQEEKKLLEQELVNWKGNLQQIDDITIMGVEL